MLEIRHKVKMEIQGFGTSTYLISDTSPDKKTLYLVDTGGANSGIYGRRLVVAESLVTLLSKPSKMPASFEKWDRSTLMGFLANELSELEHWYSELRIIADGDNSKYHIVNSALREYRATFDSWYESGDDKDCVRRLRMLARRASCLRSRRCLDYADSLPPRIIRKNKYKGQVRASGKKARRSYGYFIERAYDIKHEARSTRKRSSLSIKRKPFGTVSSYAEDDSLITVPEKSTERTANKKPTKIPL